MKLDIGALLNVIFFILLLVVIPAGCVGCNHYKNKKERAEYSKEYERRMKLAIEDEKKRSTENVVYDGRVTKVDVVLIGSVSTGDYKGSGYGAGIGVGIGVGGFANSGTTSNSVRSIFECYMGVTTESETFNFVINDQNNIEFCRFLKYGDGIEITELRTLHEGKIINTETFLKFGDYKIKIKDNMRR